MLCRYASYYESILLSQYNQLYQKGREIEHYRSLAGASAHQTWEEGLVFLGGQVQGMVLEITALRAHVRELERQVVGQVGNGVRGGRTNNLCVCVCVCIRSPSSVCACV